MSPCREPARDRAALLLHRLAALHALTPAGRYPLGQGTDGALRVSDGWTTGFWPGSLWQAADLTPQSDLFARWALAATLGHLGRERQDTHDLGFIYGSSSVAGYRRLCRPRVGAQSTTWDDDAELIFGVHYALEAVRLSLQSRRRVPETE